jgi:beta-phosphoglucomutase-like phosphatase (HAD superfamily)
MLRKVDILDRFSIIVCGDEVTNGKPAPDIFLLAFEGSSAGLMGLHSAGIRSIFIKDVIEPSQDILATVWRRYNDLKEAVELFNL